MTAENQNPEQEKSSPENEKLQYKPRRIWQRIIAVLIVGFAVFLGLASYHVVRSGNAVFAGLNDSSFFSEIIGFIQSGDKKLVGENEDRVNVLLIGIGGEGHEGGLLADTIILANIKPSTKEVVLLSIPRDLTVNIPGYGERKINNANAFGAMDDLPGGGGMFTARILSNVLNTSIPYYMRVDFSGFKKLVDDAGGVNIDVDKSFTDSEYPTTNFGYQTISFKQGNQKMDGDKALKYTRSRHGNNGEGSDFARSRRQQKVIMALKDKMLSLEFLANPEAVSKTAEDLGNHIKTNLKLWEIMRLRSYAEKIGAGSVASKVLENNEAGMLKSETGIDGAYLLMPREKDFSEIQEFSKNIFNYSPISNEKARLDLFTPFAAAKEIEKVKHALEPWGIEVVVRHEKISSDQLQILPLLADFSSGKKPNSLKKIKEIFPKAQSLPSSIELPEHPKQDANKNSSYGQPAPDFVIIMDKTL
ncbi:MAG: LCP family protein [Patescibacteria group bacterium]